MAAYTKAGEGQFAGRRILVPIDGSVGSERALAHALYMLATNPKDQLLLLSVVAPPPPSHANVSHAVVMVHNNNNSGNSSVSSSSRDEDNLLALLSDYANNSGWQVNWERRDVTDRDPRPRICREALEWGADYICMGARGKNVVAVTEEEMLPVGSTTDYVMRHAPCSVIVVRKKRNNK